MTTDTDELERCRNTIASIQATLIKIDPIFKKREHDFYIALECAKEALDAILQEWDICINCHLNLIEHKESKLCSECLDELQQIPSDSDLLGW